MAIVETIVWTLLPNGYTPNTGGGGTLHFSLFCSPQLKATSVPQTTRMNLGDFSKRWQHWPDVINNSKFDIEFVNGASLNSVFYSKQATPDYSGDTVNPARAGFAKASTPNSPTTTKPDTQLWSPIFTKNTYVRPYSYQPMDDRLVYSYPMGNVHTMLGLVYAGSGAVHPPVMPSRDSILSNQTLRQIGFGGQLDSRTPSSRDTGSLSKIVGDFQKVMQTSADKQTGNTKSILGAVPPTDMNPELDFAQLLYYWQPRAQILPQPKTTRNKVPYQKPPLFSSKLDMKKPPNLAPGAVDQNDRDFHEILSSFGDYPLLMRHLGIVTDLTLDIDQITWKTLQQSGPKAIQVKIKFPSSDPETDPKEPLYMKTYYELTGEKFFAQPQPDLGETDRNGLLILNNTVTSKRPEFEIIQIDVDGAALSLTNMVNNVQQSASMSSLGSRTDAPLQAMRTVGITLSRAGNALKLTTRFKAMTSLHAAAFPSGPASTPVPQPLYAEGVLRGYRLDVYDERSQKWYSLYQRTGTYTLGANSITLSDEASTQVATSQAADGSSPDLYVNESFVRWSGWSLAVRKPTTVMDNDGNAMSKTHLDPANPNIPFTKSFSVVPGSLPRLRFGNQYRLRVRTVDLAGNSQNLGAMTVNDPAATVPPPSQPIGEVYKRFEPIAAPAVVLRDDLMSKYPGPAPAGSPSGTASGSPGESLEHIVIRSYNGGTSPDPSVPGGDDSTPTKDVSRRHFAAPKQGIDIAEASGMLDVVKSGINSQGKYTPAQWDAMSPTDKQAAVDAVWNDLTNPPSGPIIPDGKFDVTQTPPPENPENQNKATWSKLNSGPSYPIFKSDQLLLPYLPDPIARGVTMIGLPDPPTSNWAEYFPASANAPTNPITGLTEPKGFPSVSMFNYPRGAKWFNVNGVMLRVVDATTGPGTCKPFTKWDAGANVITLGLCKADVMEIPYSSLFDVKAIEYMGVAWWIATLLALEKIANAPPALVQAILQGRHWMFSPFRTLTVVHATAKPLSFPAFSKFQATKALTDTFADLSDAGFAISGKSTGKVDLRSAWIDFVDDLRDPIWKTVAASAQVSELKVADYTVDPFPFGTGTKGPVIHHNFGDTKHRWVQYTGVATTRFKGYFDTKFTSVEDNITLKVDNKGEGTGDHAGKTNILSSKRPDAPDVLYIVPLSGWQTKDANAKGAFGKRHGNALRVYMNRPWFSSGEGEQLGVLIWTGPFSDLKTSDPPVKDPKSPEAYTPYVTQWGRDPIWSGGVPTGKPSLSNFPRCTKWLNNVTLEELTPTTSAMLKLYQFQLLEKKTTGGTGGSGGSGGSGGTGSVTKSFAPIDMATRGASAGIVAPKSVVFDPNINQVNLSPNLMVLGHDVQYDADRQLWFCDIEIDTGANYTPFVRLGLTRFQYDSVPDAYVSKVIMADFAQLLPDRNVGVVFDPSNPKLVAVAISGQTYTNNDGHTHIGSTFEVAVEIGRPDLTDDTEEFEWVPLPDNTYEMLSKVNNDGTGVWTGLVQLPEPRGSRKYRLVFREYEHFLGADDPQQQGGNGSQFETLQHTVVVPDPNKRRIVFADSIEI